MIFERAFLFYSLQYISNICLLWEGSVVASEENIEENNFIVQQHFWWYLYVIFKVLVRWKNTNKSFDIRVKCKEKKYPQFAFIFVVNNEKSTNNPHIFQI